MINRCFKQQRDFILDRSRRKTALCSRRAGKSYSALVLMCRTALLTPNANIRYVCLTRGQAKDNLWAALKTFAHDFELDLNFHETNLSARFPNGSEIKFLGGETLKECEKMRGQFFHLVVLDECKSFQAELLIEFIEEIISPALADYGGTLAMIGTPGNVLAGPFYEATSAYNPNDPLERAAQRERPRPYSDRKAWAEAKHRWNWSFHKWHTSDNTAMPQIWQQAIHDKAAKGIPDNDPRWLREWMGEWCPSDSLMVYSFAEKLNTYSGELPEGHEWRYLLGLDFGYHDSTAFVVAAFSDTHPLMYQVFEHKDAEMTFDAIERKTRQIQKAYPDLEAIIADTGGLGKTIVESYRERGIAMEAAVKNDKLDHIELVNSDLLAGNIKILPDSSLAAEMKLLQWTDRTYKKENKGTDNHCCDAFLYLIRHAYHHFWEPAVVKPSEGSPEAQAEFDRLELESMLESVRRENSSYQLDDFDDSGLDLDLYYDDEQDLWMN